MPDRALWGDRGTGRSLEARQRPLVEGGPDALHVVADWDRTLTTARTPDGRDQSTYAILYDGGYLGPDYQRRSELLYRTYRASERSADLAPSEKHRRMAAWWTEQFDLMLAYGFSADTVRRAVADDRVRLRAGALSLLRLLSDHGIPLLILSAGIASFIRQVLAARGAAGPGLCVVANEFTFRDDGRAVAYRRPLIHSLNKHRPEFLPAPHLAAVAGRPNCILLGDTLEDVRAADGLQPACTLRYGFPESSRHPSIGAFHEVYDVVVPDDGPLTPVLDLVGRVARRRQPPSA